MFGIFNEKSIISTQEKIARLQVAIAAKTLVYQAKCKEIEDKYGPDCLALLRGQKPEQPVKSVNKIVKVRNSEGVEVNFREEYIKKRDGSLVLLRAVGFN